MVKPAKTSLSPAPDYEPGISSEREQLLFHTRQTGGCMRRASIDNDEHSTQCQACRRDEVNSTSKQKCARILDCSSSACDADDWYSRYGKIDYFSPWFPETDPKHPRALTWTKKLSHRGTALFIQIVISTTVLMFNISVMIYAAAKYGISSRLGDIYQGDCNLVGRYNILVHLGINVVSTLLLGSSNYCAQLLVAPTRSEVDKAHDKGDWLDVGVPSLRNLWKKRIAPKRKAAWTLLMISSVLLHLVWNSAVFAARPFSLYQIAVVTSDYLSDAGPWPTQNNQTLHMLQNTESLFYLNKTQCIERYINSTPGQMDVLVVAANVSMQDYASLAGANTSSSLLYEYANVNNRVSWIWAQSWLCSAFAQPGERPGSWCTAGFLLSKEAEWTMTEYTWPAGKSLWVKVDHCLSAGVESLERFCALRYSAEVLLMVCILNLAKCAAIYYTAYLHYRSDTNPREKASLVTVGDAAASFLAEKDLTTEHLSFASREEFTGKEWPTKRSPWSHSGPSLYAIRWFRAASLSRWLVTLALCVVVLVVAAGLLAKGIDAERKHGIAVDIRSLTAQGLGTPRPYAAALTGLENNMSQLAGFYVATLFANTWQVIYSALYLLYNGILTTMLVANEWNGFIEERKTLRLSSPLGIQRSSYFLSLPYRFGLPLMIASGIIHWLISQSVFVIQSIAMAYGTSFYRYPVFDSSLIGYSNIGIIYCIIVGSVMIITLVTLGLCKSYRPRKHDEKQETDAQSYTMPLVSTCSAAISAACHRPDEDFDSHLLPVRWGFVEGDYWCFTTSREVSYPELGSGTELEVLSKTNGNKESHRELRIDLGPAFELSNQAQEVSSHDDASFRDQRGVFDDDTSALLPWSQFGS